MADLSFLDSKHDIYSRNERAWEREERRLVGGDAVLEEVVKFAAEETDSYNARLAWARWLNFPKLHTSILSGHIKRQMPTPNYGPLGEVKDRDNLSGSLAEVFHYNCDGVGQDGQQLPEFMDGVVQRALATGFRWLMVELPTKDTLEAIRLRIANGRAGADGATDEEVRAGFRPFLVEYSPLAVTNWRFVDGVLVWAVVRIPVVPKRDFDAATPASNAAGYYLLVRKGYTGLGEDFQRGGWWKYDAQRQEIDTGTWADTGGQIPMWVQLGEPGQGTYRRESIGTSATMELGQISADLMNAQSEQRFNLRQAAKSVNYWIGMDTESHGAMTMQLADASINVGIPFAKAPDGTYHLPQLVNSSGFVLDASAYQGVIDSAIAQAKEVMVRQLTSGEEASGVSRETAFGEATSPLLSRVAGTTEGSMNTGLYFTLRRFGLSHAQAMQASVTLPREYRLRDLLSDIDTMLDRLAQAAQRSPTWESALLERKGKELDLLPDQDAKKIVAELRDPQSDKADLERSLLQAQVLRGWLDAGATEEFAMERAKLDETEKAKVFGAEPAPAPVVNDPNATPNTPVAGQPGSSPAEARVPTPTQLEQAAA